MIKTSREKEFTTRLEGIRSKMSEKELDLLIVYGDEYRKENLRYCSDFWPFLEQAALLIPSRGEPVLIAAAEGKALAQEMSIWKDIRIIREFECVTVPESIEYPFAEYTNFEELRKELSIEIPIEKVGIVGLDYMPSSIEELLFRVFGKSNCVDANKLIQSLRIIKSSYEVNCFRKAQQIADAGYKELIKTCIPGNTELQAVGAAEYAARKNGAEDVVFCIFGSGERTNTVIGRPSEKYLKEGEIIMAGLAVQYEGYIASIGFPFVIGTPNRKQIQLIDTLIEASDIGLSKLGPEVRQGEAVKAIKDYFKSRNMDKYDFYPPFHGAGLAEAESPYPNETTDQKYVPGMIVNTDISLFSHSAGSNRIEEGIMITKNGIERFSQLIPQLINDWKDTKSIRLQSILWNVNYKG